MKNILMKRGKRVSIWSMHFLILIERFSSRTGIWRPRDEWWSLGTSSLPRSLCGLALLILFKSLCHETKSLDFATFIRNQLLIPESMLWVHIKSGYDSRDDVFCRHKIRLWFQRRCYVYPKIRLWFRDDISCTHKIRLWSQRWCYVYT